ncbi:hypothetical protein FPHOBKDP_00003 [Listeria phage LPJP1]|nr:hypothetical protein FPHOBKDP_00003 [Listeria phage LPJP1]
MENKKRKFLALCGISGSGKNSVESILDGYYDNVNGVFFKKLNQVTTRNIRNTDEFNSGIYSFITIDIYNLIKENLIGKTVIDNKYYYGTLDTSTTDGCINTIIVNAKGLSNLKNDLNNKYGEDNYDLFVLQIANNTPVERRNRDAEFIRGEYNDLKGLSNATLINNPSKWLTVSDVINCLKKEGFLDT